MKKILLSVVIAILGISTKLNAQVGINMTTPHAPLQFKNETVNRKIVLFETGNDDNQFYGLGVNPGILRYQVDVANSDHAFYAGTSATTSNELMRIKGTGNVGIGTSTPHSKLDLGTTFGSSLTDVAGKKLAVYNAADGTDFYGLGINGGALQFHAASTASDAPAMVLTGNGSVGIGTAANAPTNTLDVAGTARVRTMNNAGSGFVTPVYSDANGVLIKSSLSSTSGGNGSNAQVIGAGSTQDFNAMPTGLYRVTVMVSDACNNITTTDFLVHNVGSNGFFGLNGQDGFISSGTSSANNHPTFTQTVRNSTSVTWSSNTNCGDGGDGTAMNYTVSIPTPGTLRVANNGNVGRYYRIIYTRLD